MIRHVLLALILITTMTTSVFAANNNCLAQASTDIERGYCKILAYDYKSELPHLDDFKKNPEKIQRLLLKREAQRYNVELAVLATKEKPALPKKQPTVRYEAPASINECTLHDDHVSCVSDYYKLVNNLKNNQLQASAFSSYNELKLPSKNDTTFKDDSDYRYLSHIYPMYIYKMLELGLGDSTMSFTKFATVYWQAKLEKTDFSERFRFMYNQLKIEKSRNAVKTRYRSNYPNAMHQCMRLDSKIIVCDDMKQNWVYKLR